MSREYYGKWWIRTKEQMEDVKKYEQKFAKLGAIRDRELASRLIGGLYTRYNMLVQNMDTAIDQYCQAQKGITMRKLMDAANMRLKELKDELVKIDVSEFHYLDSDLVELKLIPHSIDIIHPSMVYPRYYEFEEFWTKIKNGEEIFHRPEGTPLFQPIPKKVKKDKKGQEANNDADIMAQILAGGGPKAEEPKPEEAAPEENAEAEDAAEEAPSEEAGNKKDKKKKGKVKKAFILDVPKLSAEEQLALHKQIVTTAAIMLIQKHERGRQGRLYYADMCMGHSPKQEGKPKKKESIVDPEKIENAAITIQRYWEGHRVRNFMKRQEISRRLLIGMVEPSWKSKEAYEHLMMTLEVRRQIRLKNYKEYVQANENEKARVLRVIGPGLFEDIGDEIREWFHDWHYEAHTFQEIPPEEQGGTVVIMRGEMITIEQYLSSKKEKPPKKKSKEEKAKEKAAAKEKKRKEAEAKKKAKEAAKQKAKDEKEKNKGKRKEYELNLAVSPAAPLHTAAEQEYHKLWDHVNDDDNPEDKTYMDMITDEKCLEMQMEIRQQVDEVMRLELEILQLAAEKDKFYSKKQKGKFKPKKPKKKKAKKPKKEKKDPTGYRTIEDLFQEMVVNGIIRTYPKVGISDYKGDFSYANYDKRQHFFDPPPTLGDVRQAVVNNCILPLGAESMVKPKSVLIAGPRQSGKHLLANAIFNETRCVLFDISPPVMAGKYPGKAGMKVLIELINKMSRLLQPSIIFIDGGEKPFYGKIPKEEKQFDPKRVGKVLGKLVKPIKPEDRVLILGISAVPWGGSAGKMKKTYQKVILIPRPDYGSVFLYWRELLMPYHGVDRNIDISAIAKLTEFYPLPSLRDAAETALVPRRLIQLAYKPLNQSELLTPLLGGLGPITEKEYEKFLKWYSKLPMGKERGLMNELNEKIREKEEKAAAKAAAKGKK